VSKARARKHSPERLRDLITYHATLLADAKRNRAFHRALRARVKPGSSVLDLGSGSGVLAIVAAKRGFAPVIALDSDANAVRATVANAAANGVTVDARQADILEDDLPETEVAIANITHQALSALAPRVRCKILISSGYLPTDPSECPPFRHVRRITRDGWAADLHEAP